MKAKKILWILLLAVMLAVFAISAGMVINHLLDRGASQRFQDELIDEMVTVVSQPQDAQPARPQGEAVLSHARESLLAEKMETDAAADYAVSSEEPMRQVSVHRMMQNPADTSAPSGTAQTHESESAYQEIQADSGNQLTEAALPDAPAQPDDAFMAVDDELPAASWLPASAEDDGIISAAAEDESEFTAAAMSESAAEPQIDSMKGTEPGFELKEAGTATIPPAEFCTLNAYEPGATLSLEAQSAQLNEATASIPTPAVTPEPTPMETAPIAVNFDKLTSKYKDVKAWVYLPETPINYAVAQGKDNYEYLRKRLDRGYSYSGSIFLDSKNKPDFSDWNTILYGHNMKNGSMFGYLPYYAVQEYYDRHPVLYVFAPGLAFKAEVFAGYVTTPDSDAYLIAQTMEERDDIIAEAKSKSTFTADVQIGPEDRIVTLSTCTYAYDNARYVLLGVLRPLELQTEA